MMNLRVIRNMDDYKAALGQVEQLIEVDPAPGTDESERLEVLAVLVEDFEKRKFRFNTPDPISAIEYRMHEYGLQQRDLVPMLGSRSRVSEILAGKRPLTVPMIRALSSGLGIPAEILVAGERTGVSVAKAVDQDVDWSRFPVREMQKRGWISSASKVRSPEQLVREFFSQAGTQPALALYRRRIQGEGITEKSRYSVLAWTAKVLSRAKELAPTMSAFNPSLVTPQLVQDLVHLSWFEEGPRLAVQLLAKSGICVVIEPKLPNAPLDGAALLTEKGQAVIGLTLRYDRVDSFWFTLLHELAHVWKHLSSSDEAFVDRLESVEAKEYREKEANRFAREAFIPRAIWRRSAAYLSPTRESVQELADRLRIHPGIVVGRLHYETKNYAKFTEFLRNGTVRKQFQEQPV